VNLVHALGFQIGVRTAGSEAAARAAEMVAEAFRELGFEPRLQEFDLLVYEPEEPELEVDGARVEAGPCMYSHPGEVEGPLRRLSDGVWAVGDRGRLFRSPFGIAATSRRRRRRSCLPPTKRRFATVRARGSRSAASSCRTGTIAT
jgi:hypothetical protein